jgi:predicted DNA-binding ribbon-helix-helix protein
MVATESLGVYLNDHLGGAAAGVEMAEKLRSRNDGTPFGNVMAQLVLEIKEDRATLENLMDRLGVERNPGKLAAGRGIEKIARLRTSKTLTGSAELSRLMDIEGLALGIEGKYAMWRELQEIAELDQRLASTDLEGLASRARRQRDTLEPYRLQCAPLAFAPGS